MLVTYTAAHVRDAALTAALAAPAVLAVALDAALRRPGRVRRRARRVATEDGHEKGPQDEAPQDESARPSAAVRSRRT